MNIYVNGIFVGATSQDDIAIVFRDDSERVKVASVISNMSPKEGVRIFAEYNTSKHTIEEINMHLDDIESFENSNKNQA